MVTLELLPGVTGTFTHDGHEWRVESGEFTVDDPVLAEELVDTYVKVRASSTPPIPPDVCGAIMTDGSECERPADSCPYHS